MIDFHSHILPNIDDGARDIEEKHFAYCKNEFEIIVKILSDNNILIESELNEYYKTIGELKHAISTTKITFDKTNYFVKKAEEELDKIKNMEK